MKNNKPVVFLGMLAMALVFGFTALSLTGCDTGGGGGGRGSPPPSTPPTTPKTVAVDGVTLARDTLNLTVGGSTGLLIATVTPGNATNKTVTWSSDNTSVAMVSNGTVTAIAQGTAVITVTTQDGGKTAACAVNVSAAGTTINVTFNNLTANGSSTQTTTQLTLTFSQAITGLNASYITLSGVSGVAKGALSGSGPSYTLGISGFTSGGTLSVAVANPPGYDISGSPRTTAIYYIIPTGSASFTLTFAQIADISVSPVTGPTIYRTGSPTSVTVTLDNSSQYTGITWRITGTSVTGTGASFNLTTVGNPVYNEIGQHFLTVEVTKGGVPYNKTIVFTVAP